MPARTAPLSRINEGFSTDTGACVKMAEDHPVQHQAAAALCRETQHAAADARASRIAASAPPTKHAPPHLTPHCP
jgi:hypothetical protein